MKLLKNTSLALLSTLIMSTQSTVAEVLTDTQLHATLGIVTHFILDDSGISHNGTTYGEVTSPYTGRVWLDRNLGANRVCTSLDDTQCYGDYYQWGRNHDGHQEQNSSITTTLMTVLEHGDFVISSTIPFDWTSLDSTGVIRRANWIKSDGSSVCPTGFRIPTEIELKVETLDNGVSDNNTAFSNFLKLPSAGYRNYGTAIIHSAGLNGSLWTSDVNGLGAGFLHFSIAGANLLSSKRADGLSLRCIQKNMPEEHYHNGTVYGVVTSPYTGKVWLDRNLGANRICTSFDDIECYGDYYQWGRNFDGHEDSMSALTGTLANVVTTVGNGNFITSAFSPNDWASVDSTGYTRETTNWSKTDASSVCPTGFRVPALTELSVETLDNGVVNRATAFSNFLKFPSAGSRNRVYGSMDFAGTFGFVWANSVDGVYSRNIEFDSGYAGWNNSRRASGYSLRCLKD